MKARWIPRKPKRENTSSWGWNAAAYAASWLNPFSYSFFGGGKQVDPLQQVQNKQMEMASQFVSSPLKANDFYLIYPAMAKLLYYKTLELSWKGGNVSQEAVKSALSEEAVNKNADTIMKQPAFKQLDKLQLDKGYVAKFQTFMEQVSKDPTAINEVHKDYMQRLNAVKAPNASQPKEPQKQTSPMAPSAEGPSVTGL